MADTKYPGPSNRLPRGGTKDTLATRGYPGYEDNSPEGRAQIRAFNRAGGPQFLTEGTSQKEYDAAREYADDARKRSGTKQESARGRTRREELELQYDRAMKAGK